MDHLLIDLDFDEEFEKDQQQLIWIVEFNKGRPFKIVLIRKLKQARKLASEEKKATTMIDGGKEYSFDITKPKKYLTS